MSSLLACGLPPQSNGSSALREARSIGVDIPAGFQITDQQAAAVHRALDDDTDNLARKNRIRAILRL